MATFRKKWLFCTYSSYLNDPERNMLHVCVCVCVYRHSSHNSVLMSC